MQSDSTPPIPGVQFLHVFDAWGQSVPVPRAVVENAAATGQPVLIALTAEACRAALAGPRKLTSTEQAIVDVLRRVGAPMTAPELSAIDEVGVTEQRIRVILGKSEHLRTSGIVGHQKGRGYFLV